MIEAVDTWCSHGTSWMLSVSCKTPALAEPVKHAINVYFSNNPFHKAGNRPARQNKNICCSVAIVEELFVVSCARRLRICEVTASLVVEYYSVTAHRDGRPPAHRTAARVIAHARLPLQLAHTHGAQR